MTIAIGIDVGSGVIKTTLFRVTAGKSEWLARWAPEEARFAVQAEVGNVLLLGRFFDEAKEHARRILEKLDQRDLFLPLSAASGAVSR